MKKGVIMENEEKIEAYNIKAYNVKPYSEEELDKLERGESVLSAEEMEDLED